MAKAGSVAVGPTAHWAGLSRRGRHHSWGTLGSAKERACEDHCGLSGLGMGCEENGWDVQPDASSLRLWLGTHPPGHSTAMTPLSPCVKPESSWSQARLLQVSTSKKVKFAQKPSVVPVL